MEQTVGELIEMLSKFDRNARIQSGHQVDFKWDGAKCRVVNRRTAYAEEELETAHSAIGSVQHEAAEAIEKIELILAHLRK